MASLCVVDGAAEDVEHDEGKKKKMVVAIADETGWRRETIISLKIGCCLFVSNIVFLKILLNNFLLFQPFLSSQYSFARENPVHIIT